MKRRLAFASSCLNMWREYREMSELFGMYRRSHLLKFSTLGFSQGERGWQKYILTLSIFSSRLCSRKRMSLSNVIVAISGKRFFIRRSARSTFRTDTGNILSNRTFRRFRSMSTSPNPFPLLPETMKSPSMCPNPFRSLIRLGRLEIGRLPSSVVFTLRRKCFLLNIFARCDSIRLQYTLLIYRLMAAGETYETTFSILRSLPAIASGDWSSSRCNSTNVFKEGSSAIFLPILRCRRIRTYERYFAYAASYARVLRDFRSSYQIPLT